MKYAITFAAGLTVTVLATMLSLEFLDMSENGYVFDLVLWPTVAAAAVIVLGIAATYVCSLYSRKAFRISLIASLSAFAAAVVALFACLCVYFSSGDAADNNGVSQGSVSDRVVSLGGGGGHRHRRARLPARQKG